MFKNAQPLDKVRHAHLRFTPATDLSYSVQVTSVPLAASEINAAALCFPVLFSSEGPAKPLAVLGLIDRNIFLDAQGQWTALYVPAHILRYPFILGKLPEEGKYTVMIDVDAPQFAKTDGEPLFTEAGEAAEYTQKNIKFLEEFQNAIELDKGFFAELERMEVLSAKEITIKDGNQTRMIGGFRVVDQAKVNALDDATLARWERGGLLAAIHAHWLSMLHLNKVAVESSQLKDQEEKQA